MTYEHLSAMAVFARVVEEGSFSHAARGLGLSKSAVSKQVGRLEDRLGVRLLNRTTRQLSLTEAGTAFYEHCRQLVADAEAAESAVTHLAAAPRGTLRVNAPMSFGQLHVAPALPEFLAAYPELSVEMQLSDRTVDLIEEGFDLAIRIGQLRDSSLIARRLAPLRQVLCAAPSYLAAQGRPEHPHDLKDHECLIYSYLSWGREWRFQGVDGELRVPIRGRLEINNGDALLAAARQGFGIVMLPSFLGADDLKAGRLEPLLQDWCEPAAGGIHAVFPASRNLSPKVRVFVDYLARRFAGQPYWEVEQAETAV
ncbi:LysR family transcriptional regulator [Rhodovibrio salinarum]|uniref:LysR family transcriptional regulator n=1 Tax=Rhodovibrio salinarum TaxID=1087 RepID=A0A934QFX4_9PROT|nr:LysR family transcriptional regulator [Rhodovibrio salinarum]MBK1696262.1 LysR family transcriptional regulator [Rhodovibrio salinarum]